MLTPDVSKAGSLRDLITMLDDLRARGVKFRSLTEAIDMWQMIGVLAESERSLPKKMM